MKFVPANRSPVLYVRVAPSYFGNCLRENGFISVVIVSYDTKISLKMIKNDIRLG